MTTPVTPITMERLDVPSSQIGFMRDGSQYLTFRLGEEEYGVEI